MVRPIEQRRETVDSGLWLASKQIQVRQVHVDYAHLYESTATLRCLERFLQIPLAGVPVAFTDGQVAQVGERHRDEVRTVDGARELHRFFHVGPRPLPV